MSDVKPKTDPQKAFMLSLALGAIADVRQSEHPKSKRERYMMQCEITFATGSTFTVPRDGTRR